MFRSRDELKRKMETLRHSLEEREGRERKRDEESHKASMEVRWGIYTSCFRLSVSLLSLSSAVLSHSNCELAETRQGVSGTTAG